MKESLTIDMRGQICPSTLLTALRALNTHRARLRRGELELLILTDARDATGTIPEAAGNMGYRVRVEDGDRHYAIRIGT